MKNITALVAGGLFGLGLVLSGMVNAERVLGFFDVFGAWDPTLVFVIIGANIPMIATWLLVRRRTSAVLGGELPGPASTRIDQQLVGGSLVFGVGWGLVGLCPGTVMAAILLGNSQILIFAAAMLTGFLAFRFLRTRPEFQPQPAAPARKTEPLVENMGMRSAGR